ncbi:NADH-quinone oxidoreductase subunit NuoG [Azospira inquinata]|uniref:NADH-quinone oxidoreductase n=1 Tax=Azospira inquinata TaxID=2785627 RepID=A0A975XUA7_9RHOO|nr:NADH-quinone oxidoreductase subunit NuoG [Azospira inquinata]QWT46070.1 NADH-quinone oxidoreductase subunit G [Azospira inquinata]QWT48601.1 NADH-quinone oxidoreductase subunit G [Azospira inquinata]
MLEIEIDGKKAQVQDGSTVMEAAHQVGVYIPHFCYHKKLSIAANCRMCLVQVEKAPKPLPACATPVTNGMKVFTHSELAVKAQKGVMEFLLINHPLDCPICDQGGECQLQDLAVGYGKGESRYQEEKHVVFHKNVGPLISMEEMSRCIHCTRCVRFGQEIAGIMELGMANRNYHSEITTFMGRTVDSELSGNAIDLCPVGALTSKPFRYSARTWEMQRRRSVSPHDALGANLTVQVKNNKVMRVLPFENEEVNECWISDKDRFSYTALNSAERLTKPMVKQGGQWQEVEWNVAIDYVAHGLKDIAKNAGADALGFLVSPHATLEEMALVRKLAEGLGTSNYDFRLRQQDFGADQLRAGTPWLGMRLAQVNDLDSALVVGSFLRKDAPLFAQRLRQGAKKGCAVSLLDVSADDQLLPVANRQTVAPTDLAAALAKVLKAALQTKGEAVPEALLSVEVDAFATQVAASLSQGEKAAVFLGSAALQGTQATQLHSLAQQLAEVCGATLGFIGEAANSVGGYLAGLGSKEANAQSLLTSSRQAYLLLGAEPEYDFANPAKTLEALKGAQMVVMASAFKHGPALDYADVLLPIAPFTETSGTFVNMEGRVQSFHGVVSPLEEARPAWKVLRVLGNVLSLPGFDYESSEGIRDEVLGQGTEFASGLDNSLKTSVALNLTSGSTGLQRIADVPIHFADPLARRSQPLVQTKDGAAPKARIHPATAAGLGLQDGDQAKVKQGAGEAVLTVALDEAIPAGCVRVSAAHASTASLGDMYGPVVMERA